MTHIPAAKPPDRLPWTRLILIAAAAIAIAAIGTAWIGRKDGRVIESTEVAGQPGADVGALIAKLEERLKQDPSNPDGWRMLGWSYFATGRYDDAVHAYQRATQLKPASAELWSALGESLVMAGGQGVSSQALAAFEKALATDPKDVRARFFMGAAKVEKGDPKGAVNDWIALLRDSPPNAPWAVAVRQRTEQIAAANGIIIADLPADPESAAIPATPR